MSTRLGASRMSSVLGLKARPQTAKLRSLRSRPKRSKTLSTSTTFCASLTESTACIRSSPIPVRRPIAMIALMSFGKHEPP